jgi:hypothetical protein
MVIAKTDYGDGKMDGDSVLDDEPIHVILCSTVGMAPFYQPIATRGNKLFF